MTVIESPSDIFETFYPKAREVLQTAKWGMPSAPASWIFVSVLPQFFRNEETRRHRVGRFASLKSDAIRAHGYALLGRTIEDPLPYGRSVGECVDESEAGAPDSFDGGLVI